MTKRELDQYIEERASAARLRSASSKDAEVERLKSALNAIDDHGRALSFIETLKDAEAAIQRQDNAIIEKDAEIERLKQLITELADALRSLSRGEDVESNLMDLNKRAREAAGEGN